MKYKDSNQAASMRLHIDNCKAGGHTVIAYCREQGLAPSKFYYWQKRLQAADTKAGFTQIAAPAKDTAAAIIHFPNGIYISFAGIVSTAVLKELACCI